MIAALLLQAFCWTCPGTADINVPTGQVNIGVYWGYGLNYVDPGTAFSLGSEAEFWVPVDETAKYLINLSIHPQVPVYRCKKHGEVEPLSLADSKRQWHFCMKCLAEAIGEVEEVKE